MIYGLYTFKDIIDAVVEELKLAPDDEIELNRIKRDINMVYINQVVPAKNWKWLAGHTQLEFKPAYFDGLVSVTPGSSTITFSVAPAESKAGFLFAVDQFTEIYVIDTHTAGSTTATLTSPYTGQLSAGAAFKIWKETLELPLDCRETIEVWHDYFRQPMEGLGMQELRRRATQNARAQGRPAYYSTYEYTGETEQDRRRLMRVYPAVFNNSTTIKVDYTREALPLELDSDEPVMPIEDRIVLVYGALSRAWKRFRNPEAGEQSLRDFNDKLAQMMGRVEDSLDKPQLTPESTYLARKRGRSFLNSQRLSPTGGGSYTSPTYIKDAQIDGGTVINNITVNPGVLIDGVDISALDAAFALHLTQADAHEAINIEVTPTPEIVSTNVQSALVELASRISSTQLLPDGNIWIGNALDQPVPTVISGDIAIDNAGVASIATGAIVDADVSATAAIAHSKMAALSANFVAATDSSGVIVASSVPTVSLDVLANFSKGVTLIDDNQTTPDLVAQFGQVFTGVIVNYAIVRASAREIGTIKITHDGSTNVFTSNDFVQSADTGVTLTVAADGTNISLNYTSTSTGNTGFLQYVATLIS